MEIVEYNKVHSDKIINFLKEAHKNINKELNLNGIDSDLTALDTEYGQLLSLIHISEPTRLL